MNSVVKKFITDAIDLLGYRLSPINSQKGLFELNNGKFSTPYLMGYIPINNAMSSVINHNKDLCYQVLLNAGFRVPNTISLCDPFDGEGEIKKEMKDLFRDSSFPLFVKPNNGSQGMGIALVENEEQLWLHTRFLQKKYSSVLVQEYINAPEYRILMLDGIVKFVYKRIPGQVCGDGKSTFEELVLELKRRTDLDLNFGIDRAFIFEQLLDIGAHWKTIIPEGIQIKLSPGVSYRSGRSFGDLTFNVPFSWKKWLEKMDQTIGSRLYSIDFFMCGTYETTEDFVVIEINSNPRFTFLEQTPYRSLAVNIWAEILQKSFVIQQ